MSRLGIVVLTYRDSKRTIACLKSMVQEVQSLPATRVLVVDNASGGTFADEISAAIEAMGLASTAKILRAPTNGGYASGNNLAIRELLASPEPPDHILILNNDTELRPGAIRALLDFMWSHPECGVAGCGLEDPDGTAQMSAMRFVGPAFELASLASGAISSALHSFVGRLPSAEAHPADWVAGAAMIVRREVFVRTGLLDEGYFLYYEDVDFCLRVSRWGYQVWRVPESRVVHHVGHSTGAKWGSRQRLPAYQYVARRKYYLGNFGSATFLAADLARITALLVRAYRGRRDPSLQVPEKFLRDTWVHSVLRRGL